MKFRIAKTDIVEKLNNLQRIANKNQPNIIINSIDDKLVLSATNSSIILKYKIDALDIAGKATSINAKKFYDVVNKLTGVFEFDNGKIQSKNIKLQLPVDDNINKSVGDFNELSGVKIDLNEFKDILKRRIFACAKLDAQEVMKNICMRENELCSTDSNIMSLEEFESGINEILITQEVANEILKCFYGDNLEIIENGNKIIFRNDEIELICFKVNSAFPKYEKIIHRKFENSFKLNKAEFLKNIEILFAISNEDSKYKCKFTIEKDKMKMGCSTNVGMGNIEQDINYIGEKFEVHLNLKYLMDILKNMVGEEITFNFNKPLEPCVLKDKRNYMLIMPMRAW